MSSNTLLTDVKILRKSLQVLQNNLAFIRGVRRQYAKEFGITGAKIGQTVNIRKPNTYAVRKGAQAVVQGTTETFVPLTLACQWGVDMSFATAELTLDIDEFAANYITPAMAKLASQIDADCLQAACTGSYVSTQGGTLTSANAPAYTMLGTPGTTPGTTGGSASGLLQYNAPAIFLNAGAVLSNHATPNDNTRSCLLSPMAMANSVGGLSGLFNDAGLVSEQYRSGLMGHALGFDFVEDQNIFTFNIPTSLAGSVTTTVTDVTNTMTLASLTSATGTIKAGTCFTVATVYEVNPVNQQSTGQLQQFVVTADATISSNSAAVTVYPTPTATGTGISNGTVTGFVTGGNSGTQNVTFTSGTAVGNYQQSLAYHPDAFTLATADLEVPSGVDFAKREVYEGISMRILRQYSIGDDQLITRLDVLGGFANVRPELAVRLTS